MEHVAFVLWVMMVPLISSLCDYVELKIKEMKGIDIKDKHTKKKDESPGLLVILYILISIALW
jgi:hypothetical protein